MKCFILCGEGSSFLDGLLPSQTRIKGLYELCGTPIVEFVLEEWYQSDMSRHEGASVTVVVMEDQQGPYQAWFENYRARNPSRNLLLHIQEKSRIDVGCTATLIAHLLPAECSSSENVVVLAQDVIGRFHLDEWSAQVENGFTVGLTVVGARSAFESSRRASFGDCAPEKHPLWIVSEARRTSDGGDHRVEALTGYSLQRSILDNELEVFSTTLIPKPLGRLNLRKGPSDLGIHLFNQRVLQRVCDLQWSDFWEEQMEVAAPQSIHEYLTFLTKFRASKLMDVLVNDVDEEWQDNLLAMKDLKAEERLVHPQSLERGGYSEVLVAVMDQPPGGHRIFRLTDTDHYFTLMALMCNPLSSILARILPEYLHPKNRAANRPKAFKDSYFPTCDDAEEIMERCLEGKASAQRSCFHGSCKIGNSAKIIESEIYEDVVIGKGCKVERVN
eukprot:GHVH01004623.1.p1 GENE.GHVH01004623.1~~GHVH01004623.1.p1  ORF type:complete len:444 (+),score=72.16 GHVH01004623.1:27-1358(+)